MADLRRFRRMILVICQDKTHGPKGCLRYIIFLAPSGEKTLWVDEPTWDKFRALSNQCPWVEASVVFADCEVCVARKLSS